MPPNFYCDQQNFLEEFRKGKRWTWSIGRPHTVCGFLHGRTDEPDPGHRSLCERLQGMGLPLSFPGKSGAYTALYQCTDAALLAKAVEWMATDSEMRQPSGNIANSDLIRWQNLWPRFASFFGMELAPPRNLNLARSMADKGPIGKKSSKRTGCFEEIAALGVCTSLVP
jgi:hypothetical protein